MPAIIDSDIINIIIMELEIYTLVDITKTNITRNFKSQGSPLTQIQWDFLRNQQRNWDVVVQLLGLRSQPNNITDPILLENSDYKFSAYNNQKLSVWKFFVSFEHYIPIHLLLEDFNNIPIITSLNESVKISSPIFSTSGPNTNLSINLYFP
jgi:hypothetical protein